MDKIYILMVYKYFEIFFFWLLGFVDVINS